MGRLVGREAGWLVGRLGGRGVGGLVSKVAIDRGLVCSKTRSF